MSLPSLDISSQLVPQPVVQTGLNAHVTGCTDTGVPPGSREMSTVGKGLWVSAVLEPCIFLPSTLSPALSQARRTLAPFHSPCDLAFLVPTRTELWVD